MVGELRFLQSHYSSLTNRKGCRIMDEVALTWDANTVVKSMLEAPCDEQGAFFLLN